MQKPALIYYDVLKYRPENVKLLKEKFEVISLLSPEHDTSGNLSRADAVLTPLGYFFGKDKIDKSRKLKVIGSNTTGHAHIDIDYAAKKGIDVVTLKDHHDFLQTITPTAELTWGLIIVLVRNIVPAFSSVLEGNWERWPFGGKSMLSRMTLGVVGMGRLGRMVASYGTCFGMRVKYFDPNVAEAPQGVNRVKTLEELVESAGIVTVHIPHEPETEQLFNKELFARFKTDAYFINTSRGELVDHQALLQCLESGRLAGAAVDVIGGEFEPGFNEKVLEQPLVRYAKEHSNLIITPHIGGSTIDAWSLTQEYTIRKVIEALDRKLKNS